MTKDESGEFRVRVKVKSTAPRAAPKKAKARKGKRAKSGGAPPHRSLMDALKQITPQDVSRKPEQPSEGPPAPASPVQVEAKAEVSSSPRGPTTASRNEQMPVHFDVEEAEVEIIHLNSKSPRRTR